MKKPDNLPPLPDAGRAVSMLTDPPEGHQNQRKEPNKLPDYSNELFKTVFESANAGKSITLPTGEINVNQAFCDMLGYTKEELINKRWQDMTPREEIPAIEAKLEPLLRGTEDSARFEKRYLRKDQTPLWCDVSVSIRRDGDGKPLFFITTVIDISSKKKAADDRLRFLNVIEQSLNEIYIFGEHSLHFEFVNKGALENLGFTLEEMMRMTPLDIKPEFTEDSFKQMLLPLQNGSVSRVVFETIHRRRNHTTYPVEVHLQRQTTETGNIFLAVINDITERKKAEEQLRQTNERLKKVLEVETVGVMFWDLSTGQMTDANDTFLRMTGYSRREVEQGKLMWQDLTPPEFIGVGLAEVEKFRTNGRVGPYEKEYICSDGTRKWMVFAGSSLGEDQCVEFCVDITDRKRAEVRLRESEIRFRSIYESGPNGMAIAGTHMKFLMANQTFCRMTGYEEEELKQLTFKQITFPDDREKDVANVSAMVSKKMDVYRTEKRYLRKDGSHFWAHLTVSPIIDSDGLLLYFVGIIMDITDRKNAEIALRESEERYRTILKTAPVGIAVHQQGRIVFANPAGLQIIGAESTDQVLGREFTSIFHPEQLEESTNRIHRFLNGEQGLYPVEDRLIRFDGRVIDVELMASLITYQNEPAVQVIITDITERKLLREELKRLNAELELKVQHRTAQLLASNKELETFSYSVSHDLRAPLRHINGFVNLLQQDYHDSLPEKARHYLETISRATRQMGFLIDDLLQYSRTGRQEIQRSDVNMKQLVKEVAEELMSNSQERKINLKINKLPVVSGDRALLKLVWTNLLGNAMKYTRKKKAANISIGYVEASAEFIFFIRDNGVGFDMNYASKLFGIFQRLHSQSEFEGTGIGLANVQRIVHKHLGRVWAEAKPGKGAKFFFSLPKYKEEP